MALPDLDMKLSLPYSFGDDWFDEIFAPYAKYTESVYLPMPWPDTTTPLLWRGGKGVRDYLQAVDRLYAATRPAGITLGFLANTDVTPREMRAVCDRADELLERYPGSDFTVASLTLATRLKRTLPEIVVNPSMQAEITSVLMAMYWKNAVDSRTLTPSPEVNRNPTLLGHFKQMGFRVKLVPRTGCIASCPCAHEHRWMVSVAHEVIEMGFREHGERMSECQPVSNGIRVDAPTPAVHAVRTIVPGALPRLKGLVDIVKIPGRGFSTAMLRRVIDAYVEATAQEIDLHGHYAEPPEAWDRLATCNRFCWSCDWCARHISYTADCAMRTTL